MLSNNIIIALLLSPSLWLYVLAYPVEKIPSPLVPFHYDLQIRPRLTLNDGPQFTAPGNVRILVKCVNETRHVVLNSEVRKINKSSVKITNFDTNRTIPVVEQTFHEFMKLYVITLQKSLQIGERYSIEISYLANIDTDDFRYYSNGLYMDYYDVPETGVRRWYAKTKRQEHSARSIFPCFDEPGLKATFNITIGRESNFTALSNTPLISSVPIPGLDGWFWDTFKKTTRISTYLVAFIISDYGYTEASQELYRRPTRVYGPKYLIGQGHGDYAAQLAAKNLAFMSEFLDYDPDSNTSDPVAIWEKFDGVMENWKLEDDKQSRDLFFYNPSENTELERREIAQTLAHEVAHEWFGKLVTCASWTDIWLNEGLASYFSYLGLNHTDSEFESLKTIQIDAMQAAMEAESEAEYLNSIHSWRETEWNWESEKYILYSKKGAALLRMVENFLTKETFQKALRDYIKNYAFGIVVQDDLFKVLDKHAKADDRIPLYIEGGIKEIMDSWTLQSAYPLVSVELWEDSVVITQLGPPFETYSDSDSSSSETEYPIWYIPLVVATQSYPQPFDTMWFRSNSLSFPHNSSEWIVVNSGAPGYYRVEYDKVLTTLLQKQLEEDFNVLNYGTRSQLIDDYFTFAYQNDDYSSGSYEGDEWSVSVGTALGFTKHFANELEYVVWAPFFRHMDKPFRLFQFQGAKVFDDLKEYIVPKIDSVMGRLERERNISVGINNIFYAQLADWACTMGHGECINMSMSLFEEWKKNPERNPVPVSFRSVVYCTAVANSADNFQFALDRLNVSKGTQKKELLRALGCTKEEDKAKLLLQAVIGSCNQTSEELARESLPSLAANPLHRKRFSQFLKESVRSISDCEWGKDSISDVINSLIDDYYATSEELIFLRGLKERNPDLFIDPDTIYGNIRWVSDFAPEFEKWFEENK